MKVTANYRLLRAMAQHIVSRDERRYYLNGVCIQPGVMVATNGHILTAAKQDTPKRWAEVIIQRDQIMILPVWKKRAPEECEIEINDGRVSITYDGLTVTAPSIDGKFPDWRRAIPKQWDTPSSPAHFQLSVIKALQDFAKQVGGARVINVQHNGENPAWVHLGVPDCIGVAMPMRADSLPKTGAAPKWLFKGETK